MSAAPREAGRGRKGVGSIRPHVHAAFCLVAELAAQTAQSADPALLASCLKLLDPLAEKGILPPGKPA
ncbi:hypothetical protein GCM10017784_37150 [Deinococcus indicus]|nr:hypothetical protein GCM10017784_37150 [Deinococcus indicus]